MPLTEVVVVGAGPAGLSAAGALKQRGIDAVLFERDAKVGDRWSRRYERLCLHTVRRYSGLAHHAMPSAYPKYVPKDLFARYLAEYAEYFALDVRHRHVVQRVRQAMDGTAWAIDTDQGSWNARAAIIATGH